VFGGLDVHGHFGGLDGTAVLAVRLGRGQVVSGALGAIVSAVARRGGGHPLFQVQPEQRGVDGAGLAGLARLERRQRVRQVFDVALGRRAAAAAAVLPLPEQSGGQQSVGALYGRVAQRRRVGAVILGAGRCLLRLDGRRRQQTLAMATVLVLQQWPERVSAYVSRTARLAPRTEHPVVQFRQRLVLGVLFRDFLAFDRLLARTARHDVVDAILYTRGGLSIAYEQTRQKRN